MLKYVIMNYSCEFVTLTIITFYVMLKIVHNKNISAKPAVLLTLGSWWSCN